MGFESKSAKLDDLIQKAGGCAVVDGGFATQLEIHGASINDPLWSALCLIKDPHLIKQVCIIIFFNNFFRFFADNSWPRQFMFAIFNNLWKLQVHMEYLEAGADILVTSSYQVRTKTWRHLSNKMCTLIIFILFENINAFKFLGILLDEKLFLYKCIFV